MPRTAEPSAHRSASVFLWLLLAVGFGLRVWGIAFASSAPLARPDEATFAIEGLAMFTRPYGRLGTGWPDGFFMIWHVMLRLERSWFDLVHGAGKTNLGCLITVNPLAVILPVRLLSAFLGTATAYVVGKLAATLAPARAREAALWGTALYAVNYLVGRDGHFAVSDTALCLGVALTLLACARAAAGNLAWLPWAGFFAGCSFSIKYSGAGLIVPCVAAGAIAAYRRRRDAMLPLALAVVAAAIGVIALAPQALTHAADFKQGLLSLADRYDPGTEPARTLRGWIVFPLMVLPASFGVPGYALCLAGLGWAMRRVSFVGAPLLLHVLGTYVLLLGGLQLVFVRYGSPLVPALAAAGGAFAVTLLDRVCARFDIPRAAATATLAILALAPPAVRLAQFDHLLSRPDTRDLARDWLIGRGAEMTVLTEGGWGHVQAVEARHAEICRQELPAALWQPTPVLSSANQPTPSGMGMSGWGPIGNAGINWYLFGEGEQRLALPPLHEAAAPDFLARSRGPHEFGAMSGESNWGERDPACWTEAAHFSPGDLDAPQWDPYDAFFAPFVGFSALERPGPEIFIYENRCKHAGS